MKNKYNTMPVLDKSGARVPNLVMRNGKYYVTCQVKGKRYLRVCPYAKLSSARDWARKFIQLAREGNSQLLERERQRSSYPRLGVVLDLYQEVANRHRAMHAKPLERTVRNNIGQLCNVISKAIGVDNVRELSLDVITADLAEQYIQRVIAEAGNNHLQQARARRTAVSTLRQARSVFARWAIPYYQQRVSLPGAVSEFSRLPLPAKRQKYLLPPQALRDRTATEAANLKASAPDLFCVYLLCYNLGMRAGEAREARWEWIEEESVAGEMRRYMRICRREYWPGPKNGVDHKVPISDTVFADLRAVGAVSDEHILPGSTPTERRDLIGRKFAAWMRSIGWEALKYPKAAHELRKLAGSVWFTERGLQWAVAWLGDTPQTVYQYYADITDPGRPVDM